MENANAAARVEPRREGYYNSIQIYPWSEGALYQVYAAPGQITNIALEPGESLTGAGPIAAGDTARWIIGDTESGSGITRRVHVLVKPTRPDITTNLVITTDRRIYMIELRSGERPYMPAVAWAYPQPPASQRQAVPATPVLPAVAARNYRYGLTGDTPPWRPISVYDDGRRVYVEFPRGIVQGEMPPLFVIGADGDRLGRRVRGRAGALEEVVEPRHIDEAHPRSLSARYGLGALPFHVELSHRTRPCRYILLGCIDPGSPPAPTMLLEWRTLGFSREELNLLEEAPVLVRAGRRSFYSTILAMGGAFLRYDPGCLEAVDERGQRALRLVEDRIASLIVGTSMLCRWRRPRLQKCRTKLEACGQSCLASRIRTMAARVPRRWSKPRTS
ncbi:conjugal transfer protein TrbG/VirB9/CagX [Hyphomonas polymorpha PS728]|uniref:Conjugal transfer protein TrbG/VirB9/CagX n=1 Tax=Hyphomonas polymorpha PS728 TaxID=1280954 RepID=A0A062VBR0_9PROT|nr:conjugal transfer protein TrbG/VirB9/CagX [Hyphomonas polymorpha PS728]